MLKDRFAQAVLGAATGAVYGLVIAVVLYAMYDRAPGPVILTSVLVFSALGFLFGNFIFNALFAILYFIFGVMIGLSEQWEWLRRERAPGGVLRAFLLLGFGTGIVLIFSVY